MKLNAYPGAKLALIEKIILDLQHEGRAITHEQVIGCYNRDGKLFFVDFCRQELEESKRTISDKHYKTTKLDFSIKQPRLKPAVKAVVTLWVILLYYLFGQTCKNYFLATKAL